jgi:uncharacterized protein (TIGR03437 family)
MFLKPWLVGLTLAVAAAVTQAGTFGKVVPIGGEASDLALDESRGVLYIANFTANRIDVMSLATSRIQTSINVAPQPSSISLSPDNHWLLIAHYGNNTAPASQTNALTLVDLTANNARQTFALADPPLGVAFGLDNKALVVTASNFVLFDPVLGTTQVLATVSQVATQAIPQPTASFPGNIVQASVAASRDGLTIAGFGGTSPYLLFRYSVANHSITSSFYTSTPPAGPRVVSLSDDGSLVSMAWWLSDPNFTTVAEFSNPSGLLNIGSHVIDSSRNLVYAQVPHANTSGSQGGATSSPILQVLDSDNLTLREQLQLPENLAGKSILSSDHNTMYGVSDSGVMILPVGKLNSYPRLAASAADIVFRGNFCDRNIARQTLTITDPGGGNTPFTVTPGVSGLTVSPSSGVTPAVVTVSVDPNAFAGQKGTTTATLTINSTAGVNPPQTVRVLINSQDPSQRGAFVDVPGTIVDLLADPKRNVFYLLRQDNNQVLIYNASNNTPAGTLRTCAKPTSMAITFDQQYLLIGCDNAHIMSMYDLDTLQAQPYISMNYEYIQSIAVSSNAILASFRNGGSSLNGGAPGITFVNLVTRTVQTPANLGVWQNKLGTANTVLAASSNGAHVLAASTDGSVMIYDANANSFTVSRKDFTSLAGSYAASNFSQYVVGNHVLDASGADVFDFSLLNGSPSGFAFVNNSGYLVTAAATTSGSTQNSPGTIAQVDLSSGNMIQPTPMVEAPLLGNVTLGLGNFGPGQTCTTSTSGTTTTQVCSSTSGGVTTVTTTACTGVGTGSSTCSTTTSSGPANTSISGFVRSIAPLPNQTSIIALTTSGFTVLPWSYAASVALPQITKVVSAADGSSPVAPGGLISIMGNQLSPVNLATSEIPLSTALANSCLTVNGQPMPLIFVSPNQINAQMPSQAVGDVTINVHTPGGISDNYNLTVQTTAPAVFMSGVAGPQTNLPVVVRADNNLLVTDSNPIHRNDQITIYLTGCGQTAPPVGDGLPAPASPLAVALSAPALTLGGSPLSVSYAGLAPGEVGVCQINASVPGNAPTGLGIPLSINQGGNTQSVSLRVVN